MNAPLFRPLELLSHASILTQKVLGIEPPLHFFLLKIKIYIVQEKKQRP